MDQYLMLLLIKSLEKYDVEFYTQFDFVLCALDNAQAREHLGRMCLNNKKIMVDAGTGGFSGQVIKRFLYQCNNCQPSKGAPQFAVCTIRASPSQPIHCVTYAMALYNLLFGPLDESNVLAGLLDIAQIQSCDKKDVELIKSLGIRTFNKLFYDEIKQGLKEYSKEEEPNAINQHKYPISFEDGMKNHEVYTTIDQSKMDQEDDKVQPFSYYVIKLEVWEERLFLQQQVQMLQLLLFKFLNVRKFQRRDGTNQEWNGFNQLMKSQLQHSQQNHIILVIIVVIEMFIYKYIVILIPLNLQQQYNRQKALV
ncbi:unnamed protein product [Paramecium sonneborni]|uniref:THIF-type NAD/FAD binding fold domain-containing protein n=1 Tax=Paramecium sonneborni TaxID=65129 RepID=A0A8S1NJN0_9CILI|nr:unnamed protein product [Paramecium sonneborni]